MYDMTPLTITPHFYVKRSPIILVSDTSLFYCGDTFITYSVCGKSLSTSPPRRGTGQYLCLTTLSVSLLMTYGYRFHFRLYSPGILSSTYLPELSQPRLRPHFLVQSLSNRHLHAGMDLTGIFPPTRIHGAPASV